MSKKLRIETKDYHYACGEPGCCDEYGTILYIDGKKVEYEFGSEEAAYQYVLTHILGHEVGFLDD